MRPDRLRRLSMVSRLKARLSFANVVSLFAVFVALGGSAYAAGVLPVNSVGTAQLKGGSVTSGKVKDGTLKAADFSKDQLEGPTGAMGPVGPAGPAGVVDTSQLFTKAVSDARYLGGALVTVVASRNFNAVYGNTLTATCPAGYRAISGGTDSSSRQDVWSAGSAPMVEAQDIGALSDGVHGAPTAWKVFGANLGGSDSTRFAIVVICAPVS
jgi:hypothetical protein